MHPATRLTFGPAPFGPVVRRRVRSRAHADLLLSWARFSKLPTSLKAVLVACILALAYVTVPSFGASSVAPARSAAPLARAVLSSHGEPSAAAAARGRKPQTRNRAKTVESHSNPHGFVNAIEARVEGVFGPSVLALPGQIGPGFRFLVVARHKGRDETVDGKQVRWRSLVGGLMGERRSDRLGSPFLTREMGVAELDLPAEPLGRDGAGCKDPNFDQFVGPEDPKLFLTNDGTPLLFYSQSSPAPGVCRGPAVIDARVPFPALGVALKKAGWAAPVTFAAETALAREGQAPVEKNWVPFLGERDELWVAASAVPQLMYKVVPGASPLQAANPGASYSNCITKVVGEHLDRAYHHATPLLRVTLCRRGECVPDRRNTVLFGIVHVKFAQEYAWYERRVVTYAVDSPYQILSVSKPIIYSGTNQADPIITTTIACKSGLEVPADSGTWLTHFREPPCRDAPDR